MMKARLIESHLRAWSGVGFASVSKARYLTFPIRRYATGWYGEALASPTVYDLLLTSLKVAGIVTVVSMVVGFFGALAFACYHWRFRSLYQKLILLPVFFPQTVLALALLLPQLIRHLQKKRLRAPQKTTEELSHAHIHLGS